MTCTCSTDLKPLERNGHTASCNHTQRKAERNALKEKKKYVIPKVSKKRKTDNSEYMKLKAEFMVGKVCPIYPHLPVEDVHHTKGRLGDLFLNTDYWLAVSRKGHIKIELNPKWARENRYSLERN